MAVTSQSTETTERQLYPWTSLAGDTEAEKIEVWFENEVWHASTICSHCFARLRSMSTLEKDHWGNTVEEVEYHADAVKAWDIEALGRIGETTVRNEDGQVVGTEPRDTHSARYRAYERTACGECGSLGGLYCSDALSLQEAVDRVPALIERLDELGHPVDVDAVYDAVRRLKSDSDRTDDDKRVFATAAAVGIKFG